MVKLYMVNENSLTPQDESHRVATTDDIEVSTYLEIAKEIGEVSLGSTQVAKSAANLSNSSHEASKSSQNLLSASQKLSGMSNELQNVVGKFRT